MRITNAESGRMPEIGQFTYKQGTAPTIAYLKDLILRRTAAAGLHVSDPDRAAVAFLYLVVGGPASLTAWGIALDAKTIERHTHYCVRLYLHGLLQMEQDSAAQDAATHRRGARKVAAISASDEAMQSSWRRSGCCGSAR